MSGIKNELSLATTETIWTIYGKILGWYAHVTKHNEFKMKQR